MKKDTPAGTYTVVVQATAEGNAQYNSGSKTSTVTVTVNRANISPSVTMNGWTYGTAASNPSVSGNSGSGTVTYAYKVKNAADSTYTLTKPTNAGNYTVRATVAQTPNYNSGTATKDFTISRASISPTVTINDWTYGDTASNPSVSGNTGSGDVTYLYKNRSETATYSSELAPTDAGDYTVTATVAQTTNYLSGTATNDFTISRQDVTPVYTDGGSNNNVSFYPSPVPNGITPVITIKDNNNKTISISEYDEAVNAKKHMVTITDAIADGGNYNITAATLTYPYVKGKATVSDVPTAAELTYTGKAQVLLDTAGQAKLGNIDGTMAYALGTKESAPESDSADWKVSISDITATNAGDYYVWYKALGDESNYDDSNPVRLRVTIQKAPLKITANPKTITYGEAAANDGVTYEGLQNNETETSEGVLTGTLRFRYTYAKGGDVNAEEGKDYGEFEIIPSGLSAGNYNISYEHGTLTVNKKTVTISATAEDKVYDGNKTATIKEMTVNNADLYPGDALNVSGGTAEFEDANAGDGKTVTFTGFTLTGDKIGNYILDSTQTVTSTASVTAKNVNSEGSSVTAAQKENETLVYSGTPNKPTLAVNNGELPALAEETDFTVTYEGVDPAVYASNATAPTNAGNYKAVLAFKGNYSGSLEVPFTIVPKSITEATVTLSDAELTYTGSEQTVSVSEAKVGNLTLDAGDYDASGDLAGTNVKEDYQVTVTGKGNFKDSATATWKIIKATPVIDPVPTASALLYGKTLSESTLSGGTAKLGENTVKGSFAWKDGTVKPEMTGDTVSKYAVVFTPNDTANLNSAECDVELYVRKTPEPTEVQKPTGIENQVYTGEPLPLVNKPTGELPDGYEKIQYSIDGGKTWSDEIPTVEDAGDYVVEVQYVGDDTHENFPGEVIPVTIAPAKLSGLSAPAASAITYGQKLADSTLTGGEAKFGDQPISGTFAWKDGTYAPAVSDSDTTEYPVTFTPESGNYKAEECTVKLTVNRAEPAVTAPVPKKLTYSGAEQKLVSAGSTNDGTLYYAVTTENTAPDDSLYTTSIPTATNAGTYFVWYMVDADDNHIDTDPACVTVTIAAPEEGGDEPGDIKTETIADPAAYNTKAENLNQLAGTEMTDDEKKRVEQGETFLFYMEVKNIDGTVSEADKALIEQAAAEAARLAATGQESPATILQYLDFSLFKQIGTDAAQQIHQTEGDVSVTVDIPEDKQANGRIFFIARIHNGVVEIIAQGTGKSITCYTNLFSTYALLYVDPPKQEAAPAETMDTLLATLLSGGEDTMNLTWTTVPDATGYDVFFGKTHPKYVATVTGNSYSFTGLKKGSTYRAFVKAAGQTSPMVQCYTDKGAKSGTNPAQITLYDTELSVTVSKTARIRSTIRKPSGSKGHYNGRRFYVSSDPSIARVNRGGRVKGVSKGECNVYVMNNNGVWQRVKITVDTQPTKVAFSKARKRMKVGDTQELNVKLTPKQAETTLTWQSSDPTVATVDENGTVTATGEGRATITATAENGKTATATINVKGYSETTNDLPEDEDTIPLEPES